MVSLPPQGATIGALFPFIAKRLQAAGVETPRLDARLLIEHALEIDHAAFILNDTRRLSGAETEKLEALVKRREAREPIARIIGRTEFWSLPLFINNHVLDPRPDTETVVHAALELFKGLETAALRILDLGTGSGCLLLALLSEFGNACGYGIDASPEAREVARRNAVELGLIERAHFHQSDWFNEVEGMYDLIVSNPPYIASGALSGLAPEVRLSDPVLALDGGACGLDCYEAILAGFKAHLKPGGWLLFECGHDQAGPLQALMEACQAAPLIAETRRWRDMAGIERVVGLKRQDGGAVSPPAIKT